MPKQVKGRDERPGIVREADGRVRLVGDPTYGPMPAGNRSGVFRVNAAASAFDAFAALDPRERGAVVEAWWRSQGGGSA